MTIRSTPNRYGAVAISLHWSIATLIGIALASGFASDSLGRNGIVALRLHVASGAGAALLTVARLAWWWLADTRPDRLEGPAQPLAAAVHVLMQLLPLGLAGSGVAMLALTGTFPVLLEGGVLPGFETVLPRTPHGVAARLLLGLIGLHVAAALFHHIRMQDGCLTRMGIGTGTD